MYKVHFDGKPDLPTSVWKLRNLPNDWVEPRLWRKMWNWICNKFS